MWWDIIEMIFWVGITDDDWYEQLSWLKPDEINFWQPGPTPPRRMEPGTPFLFKLHSPKNFVVGGGFFVRFSVLPCFLAWKVYGQNNGVRSLQQLVDRMTHYRHSAQSQGSQIGCNLLVDPFFFPEADWIPIPENFSRHIQRGLTYDTSEKYGADLWAAVQERLARVSLFRSSGSMDGNERYGAPQIVAPRLGQCAFRIAVTDAYHRKCAITTEKTLPALDAAHIKDYSESGPHEIANGLLLRADIHSLFDEGYVTINPAFEFLVSQRVEAEFSNGREYRRFHGLRLPNIPDAESDLPARKYLEWHNEHRFRD